MCRRRRNIWCTSSLLQKSLVTCWRQFPAVSGEWKFHCKLITLITFEPTIFSWIPTIILFPMSSTFCWYLTLPFKGLTVLITVVTVTQTHTQWVLEPRPQMGKGYNFHNIACLTLHWGGQFVHPSSPSVRTSEVFLDFNPLWADTEAETK